MNEKTFLHKGALWMGSLALAAGLAMTGCGPSPDDGKQVWKFALEETEGGVQWAYAEKFKELVEERHDDVEVKIYPYGTLGSSQDITQQIQNNTVQFAFASAGHVGSTIPEAQVFSLHFLFSQDDEVNRSIFTDNETVYGELGEAYNEKGLELLSIVPEGWMVWSSNKKIEQPEDFDGVKFRVMPSKLLLATYEAYGASPQGMAYSEVYGGLERGQIDAQVQPMFAMRDMSFHEVQDYMIEAKNAQFVATVISSPSFLDSLPEDMRESVNEVTEELGPYIYEEQQKLNEEAAEEIRADGGTEFVRLTEEQVAAFAERNESVYDQFIEMAGPRGEKILEAIQDAVAEGDAE